MRERRCLVDAENHCRAKKWHGRMISPPSSRGAIALGDWAGEIEEGDGAAAVVADRPLGAVLVRALLAVRRRRREATEPGAAGVVRPEDALQHAAEHAGAKDLVRQRGQLLGARQPPGAGLGLLGVLDAEPPAARPIVGISAREAEAAEATEPYCSGPERIMASG
jgi:hypothetical protein